MKDLKDRIPFKYPASSSEALDNCVGRDVILDNGLEVQIIKVLNRTTILVEAKDGCRFKQSWYHIIAPDEPLFD